MLSAETIVKEIERKIKNETWLRNTHTVSVLQHLLWQIKNNYIDD